MKHAKLFALAAFLFCFSSVTHAGKLSDTVTIQTNTALNGSQASRTSTPFNVEGYDVLRLTYTYTWSSATAFEIHCETSETKTGTYRHIDPVDAAGAIQLGAAIYSYTSISSSRTFDVRIGVSGLRWVQCYPTAAGAGAGDTVTTTRVLYVGGGAL